MRKCFLHLGTPKTGTTTMQAILSTRDEELQRLGFLYPRAGRTTMPAHHNLAYELTERMHFRSEFGTIEDLFKEIDGTEKDIILSSEFFTLAAYGPKFRNFVTRLHLRGLDVVLIVYLRNQIDQIQSAYFQFVKAGIKLALNEYLQAVLSNPRMTPSTTPSVAFHDQLLDHLSVINDARLLVYSYDKARETSVIEHFLSILGLTPQALGIDASLRLNSRLSISDQFKIFFENRVERPLKQNEASVIDRIFANLKDDSIDISARTKNEIVKVHAESNDYIFAKYGVPDFERMRSVKPLSAGAEEKICLEDIFSGEAQFFVYDLARVLSGELISRTGRSERKESKRDFLARLHGNLISRHHAFANAFDTLTAAAALVDVRVEPEPFPRKRNRFIANYPLVAAYNELIAEYDTLVRAYTDLLAVASERDSLLDAQNGLLAERNSLLEAHNGLIAERDSLLDAHNGLIAEQDSLLTAHNGLIAERDSLLAAHNGLIAERDSLLTAHNGLLAERDTLLGAYNSLIAERDST